jgi:uncharacterized protein
MAEATEGRTLAPGRAIGEVLVLDEPVSFWGGVDPATGRVVDTRHPQHGRELGGTILVMPSGRGSSSSSSILAEAIRAGTAPAAMILREADGILALGAMVAAELYGSEVPVIVLDPASYDGLREGSRVSVEAGPHEAAVRPA